MSTCDADRDYSIRDDLGCLLLLLLIVAALTVGFLVLTRRLS